MKKLSKATLEKIDEARAAIQDTVDEARSYYDERSEKWQESEKGDAYQEWIDKLEELIDPLESVPEAPDEA